MAQTRTLLDWLMLDPSSGQPLYRQIYDQIRTAAISGRLAAGTALPGSRAFACSLGVSRITVLQAYDQLIAEGFLESRRGSGTRVTSLFHEHVIPATVYTKRVDHTAAPTVQSLDDEDRPGLAFEPGVPGFDTFPRLVWSRLLLRHGRRVDRSMMDYAHVGGYAPLRQALARYLVASRGVPCEPNEVVIASSARAATMLVCDVLLRAGDIVVTEDPGYVTGRECLRRAGMRTVPVPTDEQGLRVHEIVERAPEARLAYVTPSHQWPTGVTLSLPRRLQLLDWARAGGAWILEDDYDSEFRFAEAPLTALHGLADGDRVIFLGTFAKVLAPAMRCAYLVVPGSVARDFAQMAFVRGCEPPLHVQAAMADLLDEGHFARHIQQTRKVYRRRREYVRASLSAAFGDRFRFRALHGGLQLIADLPDELPAAEIARWAASHGLCARDLAVYYEQAEPPNALHLGFAAVPEAEIEPSTQRLRAAIEHLL